MSILRDLSPGQVRLTPATTARSGRWKWMLPPLLAALIGGGFLLGRQAPGPTPAAPGPAAPLAGPRPALPDVAETPAMPAAPTGADGGGGGGAIIREPSPPPASPGMPEATARLGDSLGAHPPALPRPSSPRSAGPSVAKPRGEPQAPHSAQRAPDRPAAPAPGQAAPGRAAERDVDIITAIVK